MPLTGRVSRVLAAEPRCLCFAPAAVSRCGRRLLAYAAGGEADRIFGTRRTGSGSAEAWYLAGRNGLRVAEFRTGEVLGATAGTALPAPPGTQDMTGASLDFDDRLLRAWYSARGRDGSWRIYHAASGDGGVTWSDPAQVLGPGPAGATDCEHVLLPAVLRRPDGWWMWYAGRDGARRRVHLACSGDGISWQRRGIALDLGPAGSPDAYATDCPTVTVTPDGGLIMLYGAGSSRSVAVAASSDGVTWTRLGPLVHRGAPGTPDSRYAFYPALLAVGPGAAELFYAGEDDHGSWKVLSAGVLDLRMLASRRPSQPVSPLVSAAVGVIRSSVPGPYLREPEDCHAAGPAWRSSDGSITQLRPSSVPVFAVRAADSPPVVVKLARTRQLAEREADGASVLCRYVPVPAMALHYDEDQRTAVVIEYLDGASLRELAASGDDRVLPILVSVAERLAAAAEATSVPWAAEDAAQTLQTPEITAAWIRDIARRLAPWADKPIYLNGRPLGLTPARLTESSWRRTARPPARLAYSSGDVHLGNIHVAPGDLRWWLIDLEFAGFHDPDRVIAGFLASLLKHAALIGGATATVRRGGLQVTARLRGESAEQLLNSTSIIRRLAAGPCDPARVFAFMLPSLRFRLCAGPEDTLPPATALAALALAARMTGQEKP